MANKVYVCGTLYHVFISTLKNIEGKKSGNESLLIVTDFTPKLDLIAQKLVNDGFFTSFIYLPLFKIRKKFRSEAGLFKRYARRNKYLVEYIENDSDIKKQHDFISKSEINLFSNLGPSSVYFLIRFKNNIFHQLEDGYRNYHPVVSNLKAFKRKYILNTPQGEGRDSQIKTIEVQYPEKLPSVVRHKGVKLDIQWLIDSMGEDNKQKLLDTFTQGHTFSIDGHKKVILITQPLSEDRYISEEYKINLYKQILNDHAKGYDVYIKAHPRETTDYKDKLGVDVIEIPRNFPMEILNFYPNIVFEKGITIFSGALNNLTNIKERIFLGRDYDKKLLSKKALL